MNTISSLFNFLGNVLGANPSTLTTTSKTLVGSINEVDGDVGTINTNIGNMASLTTTATNLVGAINEVDGDVSTLDSTVTSMSSTVSNIADYIVEKGTDDYGWNYVKYNSGRLEADKVWAVGQYTINATENAPIRIGGDLTITTPTAMISGSIMSSVLGNTQNSPVFLEHYSDTKIRIAKVTSSDITIQGMTIGLKLLNGRWK